MSTDSKPEPVENPEEQLLALLPALRGYARSLASDAATADDLVQETVLKAWSNLGQYRPGTNMRAWLFTIQRNTFFSLVKKRRREVEDVDGEMAARLEQKPQQDAAMEMRDFKRAFATLPMEQREVMTLIAAGVQYDEAAEICGCAIGTVKSRLNRARARLAEMLDEDPSEPSEPEKSGGNCVAA